jgi:sporulation protein YlmC with PRC-barrel domain
LHCSAGAQLLALFALLDDNGDGKLGVHEMIDLMDGTNNDALVIKDCNGRESPHHWLGDGFCDTGKIANGAHSHGDFNCNIFGCDDGDCDVKGKPKGQCRVVKGRDQVEVKVNAGVVYGHIKNQVGVVFECDLLSGVTYHIWTNIGTSKGHIEDTVMSLYAKDGTTLLARNDNGPFGPSSSYIKYKPVVNIKDATIKVTPKSRKDRGSFQLQLSTKKPKCLQGLDCAGVCGGKAAYDCMGKCKGKAKTDVCGTCKGTEKDRKKCKAGSTPPPPKSVMAGKCPKGYKPRKYKSQGGAYITPVVTQTAFSAVYGATFHLDVLLKGDAKSVHSLIGSSKGPIEVPPAFNGKTKAGKAFASVGTVDPTWWQSRNELSAKFDSYLTIGNTFADANLLTSTGLAFDKWDYQAGMSSRSAMVTFKDKSKAPDAKGKSVMIAQLTVATPCSRAWSAEFGLSGLRKLKTASGTAATWKDDHVHFAWNSFQGASAVFGR